MSGEALARSDLPPVGMLRRFLLARGWKVSPLDNKRTDLFTLAAADDDQGDRLELFVPIASSDDDPSRYVRLALETLADVSGETRDEILRAVHAIGFDRLLSTLPSFRGSISLESAEGAIRHVKRLLAHTAMNEVEPVTFANAITDIGSDYAARCRFGHTFRGSFGLTIESPVGPHAEMFLRNGEDPPPPERLFMQRLARGLRTVALSGARSDPGVIVRHARQGFNANMCQELVRMYETVGAASLRFAFEFSPEWRSPADLADPPVLEIGARAVAVAREAAAELRGRTAPERVTIQGSIRLLGASGNPADLENPTGTREIFIVWEGELGLIRVGVRIDPESYLVAAAAHAAGRQVEVTGLLDRVGTKWILRTPSDFRVLPPADAAA